MSKPGLHLDCLLNIPKVGCGHKIVSWVDICCRKTCPIGGHIQKGMFCTTTSLTGAHVLLGGEHILHKDMSYTSTFLTGRHVLQEDKSLWGPSHKRICLTGVHVSWGHVSGSLSLKLMLRFPDNRTHHYYQDRKRNF